VKDRSGESSAVHIVVVDDDPTIRLLLRAILVDEGYEVRTAADGDAALRLIDAEVEAGRKPDTIVLDLEMPVMDGKDCYRALRARGVTTPVLLLSAHGAHRAQLELGADAAMDKPFEPLELVRRIAQLAS